MGIFNDLMDIIKQDKRHFIKIGIDYVYFTVYLDDDPDETCEEKYIIPIRYDTCINACYIPHGEYVEKMEENDMGMDLEEISLIESIMKCMNRHEDEIHTLCSCFDITNRKKHSSTAAIDVNSGNSEISMSYD